MPLDDSFKIKDLKNLKYFLGFEVLRSLIGISLCQKKYALELLIGTCYLGYKPATTPMDSSSKLSKDKGVSLADISSYRKLIGKLLYLTIIRLSISFATQQLSQLLSAPLIYMRKLSIMYLDTLKMLLHRDYSFLLHLQLNSLHLVTLIGEVVRILTFCHRL